MRLYPNSVFQNIIMESGIISDNHDSVDRLKALRLIRFDMGGISELSLGLLAVTVTAADGFNKMHASIANR
jgi:hypothetical protein